MWPQNLARETNLPTSCSWEAEFWIFNSLKYDPLTNDQQRSSNIALECHVQQSKGLKPGRKFHNGICFRQSCRCSYNLAFFNALKNTQIFEDPPAPTVIRVCHREYNSTISSSIELKLSFSHWNLQGNWQQTQRFSAPPLIEKPWGKQNTIYGR